MRLDRTSLAIMRSHCVCLLFTIKKKISSSDVDVCQAWKFPPEFLFIFNPIKECYFHKNRIINFCHREVNRSNPCGHIWVKDNFSKYFLDIWKIVSRNFIILYFQQSTGRHRLGKRKSKPKIPSVSWLSDGPSLEEVYHDQIQSRPELFGRRHLQRGFASWGKHSDWRGLFLQLAEGERFVKNWKIKF